MEDTENDNAFDGIMKSNKRTKNPRIQSSSFFDPVQNWVDQSLQNRQWTQKLMDLSDN